MRHAGNSPSNKCIIISSEKNAHFFLKKKWGKQLPRLTASASLFLQKKMFIFFWRNNEACWRHTSPKVLHYSFRSSCSFVAEEIMTHASLAPNNKGLIIPSDKMLISFWWNNAASRRPAKQLARNHFFRQNYLFCREKLWHMLAAVPTITATQSHQKKIKCLTMASENMFILLWSHNNAHWHPP